MPLVSIICPLHNKGDFIAETIRSLLAQTMTDWELIIVENGSTDNGPHIAKGFPDPRITILESSKNGPGAARNLGLRHAKGEWVLFLDADDLITPEFLFERVSVLEKNPRADLIVGGWEEFRAGVAGFVERRPAGEGGAPSQLEESAVAAAPWAVHAALIRRSIIPKDPWVEELDGLPSEDTAFWFPLILGKKIIYLPGGGALYRIQEGETRNRPKDILCWIDAVAAVTDKNVFTLQKSGRMPTSRQCAAIMRGFENCFLMAADHRESEGYAKALRLSEYWLSRCDCSSLAIALRKIMGISNFMRIKLMIKSLKPSASA